MTTTEYAAKMEALAVRERAIDAKRGVRKYAAISRMCLEQIARERAALNAEYVNA